MFTIVAASLAVAVATQDQRPALPLSITKTWIETSEPSKAVPAGTGFPRVEVLNTGQRPILAWGVKWVLKRPDGQHVGSSGFSVDAAGVPPEDRTMVVAPGQTAHQDRGGAVVPADALFSDVSLTFVIFDDDTALGDEQAIARHFARRRERQGFWQRMQTILDDATANVAEPSAVLLRIRQRMEAETDPNFREEPYYNEILARMSARRMELTKMTPEKVLTNIQTTVSRQKANADAHVNRQ
ncbi:MAG TPA: hypothetical protein VH740_02885 [Vicinamibacterales bacterium]|jgi:hypothetical protein